MIIYFIRHGQTDWNAEGRLQGQKDIPINRIGREQAAANGRKLAELIPDPDSWHFVASPLSRTRETMEIIRASMNLPSQPYHVDERLMEVHFGNWQGWTGEEIREKKPELAKAGTDDRWNFVPPGKNAESYAMLCRRVKTWLDSMDSDTICVSHGGVSRCLQKLLLGLDDQEAAFIHVPQDRIMHIQNSAIRWIEP